jgi:hypothetical protein
MELGDLTRGDEVRLASKRGDIALKMFKEQSCGSSSY